MWQWLYSLATFKGTKKPRGLSAAHSPYKTHSRRQKILALFWEQKTNLRFVSGSGRWRFVGITCQYWGHTVK